MITLLAPKKIQTWDSFGRLFSDSSVIHLTYYILCFQCSSSDYLWYKVICSCEGLVLRTCNWHRLSCRWRGCFHVKRNDTRSGTHRDRTDARANDSNQICGQERQACTSGGNDGFALESTSWPWRPWKPNRQRGSDWPALPTGISW